jgi:hypothetical protein
MLAIRLSEDIEERLEKLAKRNGVARLSMYVKLSWRTWKILKTYTRLGRWFGAPKVERSARLR